MSPASAALLAWRLAVQWPAESFDAGQVMDWVRQTLQQLHMESGWREGEFRDVQLFHALFLSKVRTSHPAVNPYYYDLDEALVRRFHPNLPLPLGAPGATLIEEPPFVTIRPWQHADAVAVGQRPLVIKTPSNAYRLPFLRGCSQTPASACSTWYVIRLLP